MKNFEAVVRDHFQKLCEENLKFIVSRLNQRYGGDLGEVIEFLSNNRELDKWLQSAPNYETFFDMIDQMADIANQEFEKRNATVTA